MGLNWHDRYVTGREPQRTLRALTASDLPAAVALARTVGWDHHSADWERLLALSPEGCFALDEPDRGLVGTVTTTPYGSALVWIGMLIVAPDRQRRGLGGQLMRAALDYAIARGTERIMLDATDVGRPLYRRLGFRDVCKIERWEGRASTYLGPRARRMRAQDVPAVLELDAKLWGVDRSHVLKPLLEEFPDLAWVDYERGQPAGYLLGRRRPAGVSLGPWMSWTAGTAKRLLLVALEQLQGQTILLRIPDHNGRSLILASDHNFRRTGHCTRMIYGDATPPLDEPLAELAIGSSATG